MAFIALAKPATVVSAMIQVPSTDGTPSIRLTLGTTTQYHMKVDRFKYDWSPGNLHETTADGDHARTYESEGFLQGTILLSGWMVAADKIGIENLQGAAADTVLELVLFTHGATRFFSANCKMARISVTGSRKSEAVNVSMTLVVSNLGDPAATPVTFPNTDDIESLASLP